jgi:FkbM family methyltransferase
MRDILLLGRLDRLAADRCAAAIYRAPWMEPAFVRVSRGWWNVPAIGRFVRSVAHRLTDRLVDSDTAVRPITLGGVPLHLEVGDWTTTEAYFANALYEPATLRHLTETLSAGDVFVDVGANLGYFTLIAAGLVGPTGRVVAFEPNPAIRRRLEQSVARNRFLDRVTVEGRALSDRNADSVPLFVPQHHGCATLRPDLTHEVGALAGAPAVEVRTTTFDDWVSATALESVALMKIDVEGAELQVLDGMRRSLTTGRVRRVILETSWDSPAHRQLVELGFTPERIESVGRVDNIAYALEQSAT